MRSFASITLLIGVALLLRNSSALDFDDCSSFPTPLQTNDVEYLHAGNACVQIFSLSLPSWWNSTFHNAGIEVRNFDTTDPARNAFPLPVLAENTCDLSTTSFTIPAPFAGRFTVGTPVYGPLGEGCSIRIKLGAPVLANVLIKWGVN